MKLAAITTISLLALALGGCGDLNSEHANPVVVFCGQIAEGSTGGGSGDGYGASQRVVNDKRPVNRVAEQAQQPQQPVRQIPVAAIPASSPRVTMAPVVVSARRAAELPMTPW